MATWIKSDGSERQVHPENKKHFKLAELQLLVGGYIEMLPLPSGGWLVLNEDGKHKDLPRNGRATVLGHSCGIADNDFVVGDVLVCSSKEIE